MPDGLLKDAWLSLPREEKGYTYDSEVNLMLQFELRVSVAACGCVGGLRAREMEPNTESPLAYSDEKVANRNVRDSGDELTPPFRLSPADFPLQYCSPYRGLHVRRESLGFVHRVRAMFWRPVPNPIRSIRIFLHRCMRASLTRASAPRG